MMVVRLKKPKEQKKIVKKHRIMQGNYKDCLFNDTIILRSQ